jgi:hypothetical protein
MAPDLSDDHLRQLIAAGLSQREIARRTGVPRSTVQFRLKHIGLVPVQAQATGADPLHPSSAVQRPVSSPDTGAVSRVDTGAVQAFDTGPVQRLDALEQEVQGLRLLMQSVLDRLDQPPVQTPVQITTLPTYPKGKAVRWNLWILDAIRDDLTRWAAERDISASQLVQELLWKAINDR